MIALLEFIAKYEGKLVAYQGTWPGECLSLVKKYIEEKFGIAAPVSGIGAAWGYWLNFPEPLGTVLKKVEIGQGVPVEGDIVIWKPTAMNQYGHIDVFVQGNERWFIGFDANWGNRRAHLVLHNYENVVGWLHELAEETGDL